MLFLYIAIAFLKGALISWLIYRGHITRKMTALHSELNMANSKLADYKDQQEDIKNELRNKEEEIIRLNRDLSARNADYNNLQQRISEQKKEIEKQQEKLRIDFKNLANEILDEKTKKFTEQNKLNLDEILKPLGEKIKDFEKKVENTYEKGLKDQTNIKVELRRLHELNLKLDEDARNLTRALRSDTKKQGNWGEIVLERILERSGLAKGQEYFTQEATRNEQGEQIRPDVVINLPDNKHIIIDSKVSLLAYESFVNTDDDEKNKKEHFLKQHIDSIKTHVKNLSEKNYQHAINLDVPDFVLLFMPVESAFSLAIQNDAELFNIAWDKKIVIVSPTTLLATLRTIASIWKHEKQTQNAIEIARQGGALYDKFVLFLNDLEKMGNQLGTLQKTYDDAHKKLSSGQGNLIRRAENLRELGAKTSKKLPKPMFDDLPKKE